MKVLVGLKKKCKIGTSSLKLVSLSWIVNTYFFSNSRSTSLKSFDASTIWIVIIDSCNDIGPSFMARFQK